MFEKVQIKENKNNSGYEDWFRSNNDITNEKAKSVGDFDRLFNNKKNECRDLIVKKDLEEITSNNGYSLNRNKPEHYSSGIFSKLPYEDLKKAHTETVVPVTQEDYYNKEKYGDVNEIKNVRSRQNITPLTQERSNVLLNKKRYNNEEIATNLAYDLLKQEEEAKQVNERWWRNLKQLKY